jgi:hypothetical protein
MHNLGRAVGLIIKTTQRALLIYQCLLVTLRRYKMEIFLAFFSLALTGDKNRFKMPKMHFVHRHKTNRTATLVLWLAIF